ncbi:1-phosphatidylinositol 4,5-bisphosphate phosphodiesterase-like [Aphis craccivora]|uniref:1-phosphatidylinositol 4,5-bisphosphate phosphodiesterase-like n=1 Tax=Aphis craccivora TaxID=307492 RepID=A0A6G0WPT6_APHCR|nr:1-phosphatidylinositol 4,5-bisphosphate phosphodiesterase-like [Aphis craccivora]
MIALEETGLKLKTNKCTFLKSEIELIGHTVSNVGLKPLGKNTEAIEIERGERNFTTTELEMSAVVFATNYFREYLIGRKITVFRNYSSLRFYKTMKNPSSRITKFIFKSLEFDLEIKHRPGSWNTAANCLSHYLVHTTKITDILYENDKDEINANSTSFKINSYNIKPETLTTLQSEDKFLQRIYLIKQKLLYFKNQSPHGLNLTTNQFLVDTSELQEP